jgi:hypothetical protein
MKMIRGKSMFSDDIIYDKESSKELIELRNELFTSPETRAKSNLTLKRKIIKERYDSSLTNYIKSNNPDITKSELESRKKSYWNEKFEPTFKNKNRNSYIDLYENSDFESIKNEIENEIE